MREVGTLAITLRVGEFAGIRAPDGTLIAAVTPNDQMSGNIKLILKAPKDVRIERSKENPWTKR